MTFEETMEELHAELTELHDDTIPQDEFVSRLSVLLYRVEMLAEAELNLDDGVFASISILKEVLNHMKLHTLH